MTTEKDGGKTTMAKEYDIPGWPGYTVDEDMKVYSYKKGQKRERRYRLMRNKPYVCLINQGKYGYFSVQRLLFFASRGESPDSFEAKKLYIFKDGTISDEKSHMEVANRIKSESLGTRKDREAADTEKKVEKRYELLKYAIDLQREAIKNDSGTELFDFLMAQLDRILVYIRRYRRVRKQEIKEAWTDACVQITMDLLSSHFIRGDIVLNTLHVAERIRFNEFKESRRNVTYVDNYDDENVM